MIFILEQHFCETSFYKIILSFKTQLTWWVRVWWRSLSGTCLTGEVEHNPFSCQPTAVTAKWCSIISSHIIRADQRKSHSIPGPTDTTAVALGGRLNVHGLCAWHTHPSSNISIHQPLPPCLPEVVVAVVLRMCIYISPTYWCCYGLPSDTCLPRPTLYTWCCRRPPQHTSAPRLWVAVMVPLLVPASRAPGAVLAAVGPTVWAQRLLWDWLVPPASTTGVLEPSLWVPLVLVPAIQLSFTCNGSSFISLIWLISKMEEVYVSWPLPWPIIFNIIKSIAILYD